METRLFPMIMHMYDNRIFLAELSKNKKSVLFTEACDNYFEIELNKKQLGTLMLELSDLYGKIED